MTTTLQLAFGNTLTTEEVGDLLEAAVQENKSLERLIYEATRDFAARSRASRASRAQPATEGRAA